MIYLVEHFFSIQGEGRYAGVPSVFLRFGGCNLRCPGYGSYEVDGKILFGCDTVRAVHEKYFASAWQQIGEAESVIEILDRYVEEAGYVPDLVLTGGEPMLYAENPIFYEIVSHALEKGMRVTMETNATLAPDFEKFPAYRRIVFAMAVKLSDSKEPEKRRIVPEAIDALARNGRESFFKFTISARLANREGMEEIEAIAGRYENEIFCMPRGENIALLREHAEKVALFCMKYGYRYTDRLHIRLWNTEERR
ncbi:7-carboxy-7-deazaguanine synthase QueE [Hydrogenimonas urashimensis]|uniref:7-carboxy-7-deazaguanine synthase QueE n=1 Tax=Hydrogenimonas urashimensis TaxID=2740515 RepID=UPI0019157A20|nr:7-carboxy-7-deazaguanine synthase QueE [Hydrogenimonas urashimensis]